MYLQRVDLQRKFYPQQVTRGGRVNTRAGRKTCLDPRHDGVYSLRNATLEPPQMAIIIAARQDFAGCGFQQRSACPVSGHAGL